MNINKPNRWTLVMHFTIFSYHFNKGVRHVDPIKEPVSTLPRAKELAKELIDESVREAYIEDNITGKVIYIRKSSDMP